MAGLILLMLSGIMSLILEGNYIAGYSEPLKREYPRACKDIPTLMDLVGGCCLSIGTILDCKAKDLAGVTEFAQKLVASRLLQMWNNKEKDGRREFERKMEKRWSEIWPFGFEPKVE